MPHTAIYRPIIPFAAQHDLRLVLLNLRDYPGFSPLSPEDIDSLRGPSVEAQRRAMQHRGLEIAAFLRWFIHSERIPPIEEATGTGVLSGGLSLMAWSGGNCPTVAMVAHADRLSDEIRRLLGTHLRSFIMYGAHRSIIQLDTGQVSDSSQTQAVPSSDNRGRPALSL